MGSDARPGASALSGLVLRPAIAADLPEIAALERVAYGDPWPASAFASLPNNPRVFFTVARQDVRGALVGYVVAWYVLDEGELANLTITPSHRKRGMGGVLLDAVLSDASSRGVAHIYLEVRESNTAARRLYASRGFEEIGRRAGYYRSPVEDALVLRRTL
ncbi:MAG TPA: ribosomal protein S18-alanine N-acetyltransferase [Gemmatimonadaceae bacterium]|nr:ribosomal protein S18-alanine N-acetyltransferase [Gemmatimonadaceae bacterium]